MEHHDPSDDRQIMPSAVSDEYGLTDPRDPDQGNSLLRAMVAESHGRIHEIAPGYFYVSKFDDPGFV